MLSNIHKKKAEFSMDLTLPFCFVIVVLMVSGIRKHRLNHAFDSRF